MSAHRWAIATLVTLALATPATAASPPTLTYRGVQCVTARETSAIVCYRRDHQGLAVSVSQDFISAWKNSGNYRIVFQRRNR